MCLKVKCQLRKFAASVGVLHAVRVLDDTIPLRISNRTISTKLVFEKANEINTISLLLKCNFSAMI